MTHYMKSSKKTFSRNINDYIIRPLLRQRETGELCDVCIKLNGQSFQAHKAILALWSPYFLSMFTCDMREKLSGDVDLSESMILDNDSVFSVVLDYMYTGSINISTSNIEDVVRISDFLLLDDIKEYCKQFFLELGNLDLTNCLRVRFLAEDFNLKEVGECAQKIIESRFHDYFLYHDEILEIQVNSIFKLLDDARVVQHVSYNELKRLVQAWVDYDRSSRQGYQSDLISLIRSWVSDYSNDTAHMGRELSRGEIMRRSLEDHQFGSGHLTDRRKRCLSESGMCQSMVEKLSPSEVCSPVLFTAVCNQGLKFVKILVYNLVDHKWYHYSLPGEKILHSIPMRQTVCNMVCENNKLYLYLCSSFPYPTDMMKINILVVDLITGQPTLFSFRTVDFYNPCYRTTLTNYRTAPPVMVHCNNHLYVIGNKEGTGHLFLCNLTSHQYTCFQIPGSRFISLARAAVKENRHVYIWYRHRTGPSEEFCIKKGVGFAIFDTKTKIFNAWEISAPEISYDDFVKPFVMCIRDDTVFIHHPGTPALVLDEIRSRWVTALRKTAAIPGCETSGAQAYGYQLLVPTSDSIFVLNNDLPYTTKMNEISERYPQALSHIPPPIDNISVVTHGNLPKSTLAVLDQCDHYDEAYASALHVAMQYSDGDTSDSGGSHCEEQDSENDFEYDDDIYDYDYDLDIGFEF
ncbi:ring canal kelch homolog [Patella vulgata]|uniref:ring canal kelch homolog n=1 Tax=Patella vulgata TaxID=6465 RepID=UPI00217F8ECB|nr:ring canal kelch homolog [Patella vulgata]